MSTENLFRRLRDLTAPPPLLVAQVVSHNADGTSTLAQPGGAQFRARGVQVPVGQQAYVRAGTVEGPAPALPTFTIEV